MGTHPGKAGLAVAVMFGGLHVLWALLVLFGWAQPLVDFVFWAHMVQVNHLVEPFDVTAALALVVLASCVGYVLGQVGARVWNKVHGA